MSKLVRLTRRINRDMSSNNFLKENVALVIGVSLPVVLVALFWLATFIPRMTVPAPQFDLIFAVDNYDYNPTVNGVVKFDIIEGKLRAIFQVDNHQRASNIPRLYYFDVSSGSSRELVLDIPGKPEDGERLKVPEAENYRLSKETLAPDGYTFDANYRGGGGLFFFEAGYRYQGTIKKDGRAVKIPVHDNRYPGNLRFLGWVLETGPS